MKIAKNIFLYTLSAILVSCYFIILYISLKPNVSWEYQLYYIDKEIDRWPGNDGFSYNLGTKIEPTLENNKNCKRFGKGWGEYTEDGLWSNGKESNIYFANLPNKDLNFQMNLAECLENNSVDIYFNDNFKTTITAEELKKNMKIEEKVKKEDIIDGKLVIKIKYAENTEDAKKIKCKGINLYEIG